MTMETNIKKYELPEWGEEKVNILEELAGNPDYMGFEAGLIVEKINDDGAVRHTDIEGTVFPPSCKLRGAWCRVYRNLNGEKRKYYISVDMDEYSPQWYKLQSSKLMRTLRPKMMLRKVAIAIAHREAFPTIQKDKYLIEEDIPELKELFEQEKIGIYPMEAPMPEPETASIMTGNPQEPYDMPQDNNIQVLEAGGVKIAEVKSKIPF
jgi:hypothetical protein